MEGPGKIRLQMRRWLARGDMVNTRGSSELIALRRRAEAGDANAQYELGCKYYDGAGVEQSYAEALKWYHKAAAQGNNSGLCDTGYCYRNGYAVKKDYAKALPYYRQAADQGCPTGAYWLAHAYEHAEGVKKNLGLARRWYQVAIQRGDADAPGALARLTRRA